MKKKFNRENPEIKKEGEKYEYEICGQCNAA